MREKLECGVETVREGVEGCSVFVIGFNSAAEKGVSKKGEDEEVEENDEEEIQGVSHGSKSNTNKSTNRGKLFQKLQDTEKTESSENGENRSTRKPKFNQGGDDNHTIKIVKTGLGILFKTKRHQTENHFDSKDDSEDQVHDVLERREPIWLVVVLRSENCSIENNTQDDELGEAT